MLNELVDYIEVHQAEKIDVVHVQKLKIRYNCVGSIDNPTYVKRMRDFLNTLCADEELDTSIIPMGDGVALAYKR